MSKSFYLSAAVAALLTSAAPVAAQQVSCGGIGNGASWLGGAQAGSDISVAAAPLVGSNLPVAPSGRTVSLFRLSQPMEVRVEATGVQGGDPVLELYDAAGTLVVTDDDSGGGLDSRAELSLAAGDYCLAARGYAGAPLTANLQVSRLDQPALTVGLAGGFAGTEGLPLFVGVQPCTASTPATPLGGGAIDSVLSQGVRATNTITGVPYYRFTLGSPQAVTIRAENPSADPYIYVFDGAGNLLEENDDYESLNSRIDFTSPLPAGDYCIGMRALSDPNVPVTVSVAGFDARAVAAEQYATGNSAPPSDGSAYPVIQIGDLPSRSIRDVIVPGGQAQWFAMDIDDFGMLLISADIVNDSDPVITFFDERGQMVGQNDDSNNSLNSQLAVRVQPGRYMLGVRQYSSNYQGTIRVGIERYVPAP